jgi:hypothetical protein
MRLRRIEALRAEREYFQHVYDRSRASFDAGLSAQEAAEQLQLGKFGDWKAPTRLTLNVERAYREFRDEAPDGPWDKLALFDSMYALADRRGMLVEY